MSPSTRPATGRGAAQRSRIWPTEPPSRRSSTGRAIALEPMSSAERKIVHLYLDPRPEVNTSSEGDEPARHVVVAPLE